MLAGHRFTEDLSQLAAQAADVANRLCGPCQNYHLLWPYLRLIGSPGGAEDGETGLRAAIASAVIAGSRDILIAGAADTGLLSVVARATADRGANIVVLDRCETPLELCRRFALRWSLTIETRRTNLWDFSAQSMYNVVVAHGILPFIPQEYRLDVMRRLHRSLRPDGRLIMRFRSISRTDLDHVPNYSQDIPKHVIERLNGMNIVLPEPQDEFRNRIEAYVKERHARDGAEGGRAEVEALLGAAGFAIETIAPIESNPSVPFGQFANKISNQRYLIVAAPR